MFSYGRELRRRPVPVTPWDPATLRDDRRLRRPRDSQRNSNPPEVVHPPIEAAPSGGRGVMIEQRVQALETQLDAIRTAQLECLREERKVSDARHQRHGEAFEAHYEDTRHQLNDMSMTIQNRG